LIEDEVGINVGEAVVPSRSAALQKIKKRLGAFSEFVTDNLGGIKSNLDLSASYGGASAGGGRVGGTVVNAGMTVNYNGNLSRKKLKQLENDQYTAIKTRLQNEGAI
jgi:hypothetical protein